jgi:hypothetical protein
MAASPILHEHTSPSHERRYNWLEAVPLVEVAVHPYVNHATATVIVFTNRPLLWQKHELTLVSDADRSPNVQPCNVPCLRPKATQRHRPTANELPSVGVIVRIAHVLIAEHDPFEARPTRLNGLLGEDRPASKDGWVACRHATTDTRHEAHRVQIPPNSGGMHGNTASGSEFSCYRRRRRESRVLHALHDTDLRDELAHSLTPQLYSHERRSDVTPALHSGSREEKSALDSDPRPLEDARKLANTAW